MTLEKKELFITCQLLLVISFIPVSFMESFYLPAANILKYDGEISLTVGWDKSFVLSGETLVNVEPVRFKPDSHLIAFAGDYAVF